MLATVGARRLPRGHVVLLRHDRARVHRLVLDDLTENCWRQGRIPVDHINLECERSVVIGRLIRVLALYYHGRFLNIDQID